MRGVRGRQASVRAPVELEADPHRQPAARRAVGDHRAAHRLDEAARDREAEAEPLRPSSIADALEGLEQLVLRSLGTPGPWSTISILALSAPAWAVTSTGWSLPPWRTALSSTLTKTRCSRPAVGLTRGRSSGTSTSTLPAASGSVRERRRDDLVERDRLESGRRAARPGGGWRRAGCGRPRRAGRWSPRSSRAARRAPRRDHSTSVWRRRADARLDPGEGRAQVVADRREQRRALLVDGGEGRAPPRPRRSAASLVGGPGGGGEGLEHALVLGEEGRARGRPAAGAGRPGRRSEAAPPRPAAPSRRARRRPTRRCPARAP